LDPLFFALTKAKFIPASLVPVPRRFKPDSVKRWLCPAAAGERWALLALTLRTPEPRKCAP